MTMAGPQNQQPKNALKSPWELVKLIPVLFFALALLAPIAWVAFNGWTLTGIHEESLGVRYFYSLRGVYDPPTFLFLQQGQIIDLVNKAIQLLLTATGLPATQLFPRIDYFSYLSVSATQLFNVACFAWMASAIPGIGGRAVAAIVWLVFIYSADLSLIYALTQPDYQAADLGIALLATGAILRTAHGEQLTFRRLVGFGAMIALALAIKVTLVLFPAAAFGHALLINRPWSRSMIFAAAVSGSALAICVFIWFLNYGLEPNFLLRGRREFGLFVRTGGGFPDQSYGWPKWLLVRVMEGPPLKAVGYALPLWGAISLSFITSWRRAAMILPLFVAALLSSWILYKRDYSATLMESVLMTLVIGTCVTSEVIAPALSPPWQRYAIAIILLLAIPVSFSSYLNVSSIAAFIGRNTKEQELLPSPSAVGLRQLWLIPENVDRPLSVHSGIMKGGGAGLFPPSSWLNPDSPIMRRMFPDLTFRYALFQRPIWLERYDVIYFSFTGDIISGVTRMATYFDVDLSGWRCEPLAPIADRTVAECHPRIADPSPTR
jgi:hypothetical protein